MFIALLWLYSASINAPSDFKILLAISLCFLYYVCLLKCHLPGVENECRPHVCSKDERYELTQHGGDMEEDGGHSLQSI